MGRLRQIATVVGALVALVGIFLASTSRQTAEPPIAPVQGKNETVLFFINAEYGLSNVHLATAGALLEKHPNIEVHIASFPRAGPKVDKVSSLARRKYSTTRDIHFHTLPGPQHTEAFADRRGGHGNSVRHIMHPPGMKGLNKMLRHIEAAMSPWDGDDHIQIYEKAVELVRTIDPAIIVLDTAMKPTIDAARQGNRLYAYLSPNLLVDVFYGHQPYGGMFWKYPRMGCDFPFPVPWRNIPENIYFTVRFIYGVLTRPDFKDTNKQLQAYGIPKAAALPRPDIPWISQNMLEASIPLEVVPPNVTSAGPIVLDTEPAAQQDPELAAWLARAPTVLVNLGSLFTYSEEQATAMAQAIQDLLSGTEVQVLWKMAKDSTYSDTYALPLRSYIDEGRLRIVDWLTIDPVALLETGHIVASVHHGGANCYHEAIAAGIPQVIIPLWLDLYNYAQLAEDIGVGVYASRGTAPQWTVEGLRDSFLRAVDGGEESLRMRKKAKELSDIAQREPGRYVAARVIAQLAGSGYA